MANPRTSTPRVSCLLVTADRPDLVRRAVASYRSQTYANTELVVLDNGRTPIRHVLHGLPPDELRYEHVQKTPDTHIGALRNRALDLATGDLVVPQWDDDDWSHPERIAEQAARIAGDVEACTLPAYLVHVDGPEFFDAPFAGRVREGTCLMHRRDASIRYPNLKRTSDTTYIKQWLERPHVQLPAASVRLYVRYFHGGNLWDASHILDRLRSTPADLLAYLWYRFVRRDLRGHPRFQIGPAARASFELYLDHSRACGLFDERPAAEAEATSR
jgi:glycosyltransferase involved in cell wall biosynthesis